MDAELVLGTKLPEPDKGQMLSPNKAMQLAIQEAFKGNGNVAPNPMVGCVVLDGEGRYLAKGFHEKFGEAHAEVNAIAELSETQLKGAQLFVTLEPCAHEGKTPSCAKMLTAKKIKSVTYGLMDPNPLVSGKGAAILRSSGVHAEEFRVQDERSKKIRRDLEILLEHFLVNQVHKLPFVSLKVATSLDGMMSLRNGQSKWITCEESRNYGHFLRATHSAVLVGVETIKRDNPLLNVRHATFPGKANKVVVLDSTNWVEKNKSQLELFKVRPESDVIVISEHNRDLKSVLQRLWQMSVHSVMVEGGAMIISSFLEAKAWNRLYNFQAPLVLGGINGRVWTERVKVDAIDQGLGLEYQGVKPVGRDLLITARSLI